MSSSHECTFPPNPKKEKKKYTTTCSCSAFTYYTIYKIISERPYLFVVENLPQIIVQHVCPVVVSLQQTSKLIKIGGIHKNTLQFDNSLSFGLIPKDCIGDTVYSYSKLKKKNEGNIQA